RRRRVLGRAVGGGGGGGAARDPGALPTGRAEGGVPVPTRFVRRQRGSTSTGRLLMSAGPTAPAARFRGVVRHAPHPRFTTSPRRAATCAGVVEVARRPIRILGSCI